MKPQEMDELPPLTYEDDELIYQRGKGFKTINYNNFIIINTLLAIIPLTVF